MNQAKRSSMTLIAITNRIYDRKKSAPPQLQPDTRLPSLIASIEAIMRVVPMPSPEDWRKWAVWYYPIVAADHSSAYHRCDFISLAMPSLRSLPSYFAYNIWTKRPIDTAMHTSTCTWTKSWRLLFTGIKIDRWCRYKYDAGRNILLHE